MDQDLAWVRILLWVLCHNMNFLDILYFLSVHLYFCLFLLMYAFYTETWGHIVCCFFVASKIRKK